jgi:Domain of Unknown Function with PDB structure (DUF3857)
MRKAWFSLAASLILVSQAEPATVLSRTVDIVIEPGGKVIENHALRIRLEAEKDRDEWSPYAILADENRKVDIQVAAVEKPDGSMVKVDKKSLDTLGVTGEGVLHASQRFKTVAFPESPVGSILVLSYRVEIRPYFPADTLSLLSGAPTQELRIRITGGGPSFRYRMDGPATAATLTPTAGGLSVSGSGLPKRPTLEYAASADTTGPLLRYGWGGPSKWQDVGEWYLGLLADVPRGHPTVRQEALALKAADDRTTIAKLVEHVRSRVRYVAVEVGIGGYRPHPPEEVRAKAWGDCKDKALLLIDMLGASGIEAHPVLILSATGERVDVAFPSADQFNHLIVAIPEALLGGTVGLPVAGGFFFVDPTQEKGGLSWFAASTQDQDALVVQRGASRIVRTPRMPGGDVRRTDIHIAPRPQGGFAGKATLNFRGDLGSYFIRQAATMRSEEFQGDAESVVRARLPGSDVRFTGSSRVEGDVPDMTLTADVTLSIAPSVRAVVLPARPLTPPLSVLEGREADIVLDVPIATTVWRIDLPEGWCSPRVTPVSVENEVGLFRQKVESAGRTVTVERRLELKQHWVKPDLFPKLRELILAEHRAHARSLRFECEASASF